MRAEAIPGFIEYVLQQSPIFVILVLIAWWIAFKAFPEFVRLQERILGEFKEDNILRRQENRDTREAIVALKEAVMTMNLEQREARHSTLIEVKNEIRKLERSVTHQQKRPGTQSA